MSKKMLYQSVSERDFQSTIIQAAELLGYLVYHTFDSRRCQRGFVDLVMTKPGRCIMAELKTEKGRLRPEQKTWIATLSTCPGVEVYIWKPHQIDEVIQLLREKATLREKAS